jgi:hypothetical protein
MEGRITVQNGHPLTNQNRHLSDRLIRTIESNAEEFAESTVKSYEAVHEQSPITSFPVLGRTLPVTRLIGTQPTVKYFRKLSS